MTSSEHVFTPGWRPGPARSGARAGATAAAPEPARLTMSAWERWEMNALDPNAADDENAAGAAPRAPEPPAVPSAALLHAAELSRLRRGAQAAGAAEGHREGHAEGLAQGRSEGHAEGLAAGLAGASAQAEQLRALLTSLPLAMRRADETLAESLLCLALEIAGKILHRTLQAEPDWMLPLVRELLQTEPALQGEPRLVLHPDDATLVRQGLGDALEAAGWSVHTDAQISPGGCRVLAADSEIDATLEARWQRIADALRCEAEPD